MKRIFTLFSALLIVQMLNAQTTVFTDDFDSGTAAWTLTGQWGTTTAQAYNGTSSLTDSPGGLYLNLQTTYATITSSFDLTTALDANVFFRVKYDIENGFDYCYLELSPNNGSTWTVVSTFNGENNLATWSNFSANIGGFVGNNQVKARFRFYTDPGYQSDGIFIDSMRIVSYSVDNAPPLIVHDPAPHFEGDADTNFRTVTITDISGLSSVSLSYTVDGVGPTVISPIDTNGNDYTFAIPPQTAGAYVDYVIDAVDASAQLNVATSPIYQYIAGNYISHDNAVVSTVVNFTSALTSGAANRVSLGSGLSTLTTALIRNYTDINNPNDSIEVHVWSNNAGLPGTDLITPIMVFPEANLLEPQRMTRIDLRPYANQLDSLTGDIFIGFEVPSGGAWICQTTGGNSRAATYNGSTWTANTTTTYHFRAITTNPIEPPTALFSFDNTNDPTIDFIDLSSNSPTSWFWDFDDGTTSTLQNPTHTFPLPGTYTVSLTATNNIGSSAVYSSNVVISNALPIASYSYDDVNDPTIAFTDNSFNSPTSWFWDFGDGSTSTVQNPVHDYAFAGDYTVCLAATNQYGTDSVCGLVTVVNELPVALFSSETVGGNVVEFTNLSLEGSPGPATYLWDFDINNETSTDENPSFDYPNTGGTYNVCLTATNGIGSSAPHCLEIDLDDLTVGINELDASNFSLSPNPTTGWVRLNFNDQSTIVGYQLYSIEGAQIQSESKLATNGLDIDLSSVSSGLYFLELNMKDSKSIKVPIVKQ